MNLRYHKGRVGQNVTGDNEALDLAGALVDLVDLSIAHELLHGVLAVVTVAAEDLRDASTIIE